MVTYCNTRFSISQFLCSFLSQNTCLQVALLLGQDIQLVTVGKANIMQLIVMDKTHWSKRKL